MYLFIYFYTGPILIAVFKTEMVILFKHAIIIIIIIIIIKSPLKMVSSIFCVNPRTSLYIQRTLGH